MAAWNRGCQAAIIIPIGTLGEVRPGQAGRGVVGVGLCEVRLGAARTSPSNPQRTHSPRHCTGAVPRGRVDRTMFRSTPAAIWAHQMIEAGVGRVVPLPDAPAKTPPPAGSTGGKKPDFGDPLWSTWESQAFAALASPQGRAALVLSHDHLCLDLDTKKLAEDAWERVYGPLTAILGVEPLGVPHNTTAPGVKWHGHWIFAAAPPERVTGRLVVAKTPVGDLLRARHRYLCFGAGYTANWYEPPPIPSAAWHWIETPPGPKHRRSYRQQAPTPRDPRGGLRQAP